MGREGLHSTPSVRWPETRPTLLTYLGVRAEIQGADREAVCVVCGGRRRREDPQWMSAQRRRHISRDPGMRYTRMDQNQRTGDFRNCGQNLDSQAVMSTQRYARLLPVWEGPGVGREGRYPAEGRAWGGWPTCDSHSDVK